MSFTINGQNYVPNKETVGIIKKISEELARVTEISVHIQGQGMGRDTPGERFWIWFRWKGKSFATVIYGYEGGEVIPRYNMCWCGGNDVTALNNIIAFEPKHLGWEIADLLTKRVKAESDRLKAESDRLQKICEKLEQKPQESHIEW